MNIYLTLTPRDPLIARDGRPFGSSQGARMKSLNWPYPSVLAGSLRSLLGKQADASFTDEVVKTLKEIVIGGPLPLLSDELYFSTPRDIVVYEEDTQSNTKKNSFMVLRPLLKLKDGEGCNLFPGLSPMRITEDIKPARAPAFWSQTHLVRWLLEEFEGVPLSDPKPGSGFLDAPEKDLRTHVAITPATGTAEESLLFATVGLDIGSWNQGAPIALAARIETEANHRWAEPLAKLNALHPLGGERRLLHWQATTASSLWDCPPQISQALNNARYVRLLLATPALFRDGWKPGWLDKQLQGSPLEDKTKVTLKLVAACMERWQPLSGWSLEKGKVGPKPVRRLVPAGSVYFFEVIDGNAGELTRHWLHSIADDLQDQRDGFGLALWGIWNNNERSD